MKPPVIVATAWSAADLILRHGLQFVVIVVLARLVTPAEFGAIALLSLFVGIAGVILDGGLSTALIQRQDVTRTDESTAFWANVALGTIMALLLAASAPVLADFYSTPVLVPLTLVMAANLWISSLGSTQTALLTKRLDFQTVLHAGVLGSVTSGAVAIVMAVQGLGVWALAGQAVVMTVVSTSALWLLSGWRPTATFSRDSARRLFGFGGFVLLANLSDVTFTRLYTLLAGKLFGLREVGYYNRADTTQQLPVDLLSSIVARVALPVFSETASDRVRLREGARLALRSLMLVNVPIMLGLAALAEPFVLAVFGEQWSQAVPLLQILCLAGALWPLHVVNVQVLMAQGHARLVLWLELVKKSFGIVALVIGAWIAGLQGLAWAQVAFGLFACVANAHHTRRLLSYGAWQQVKDVLPVVVLTVPIALAARVVADLWDAPPALLVAVVGTAGGAIFLLSARALRLSALQDLVAVLRAKEGVEA